MGNYLFFTDIDGTLLRGKMPIPESVKAAARRFDAAGGILTLSTGRSHLSCGWIARELEIRLPCILLNGAMLYDFGSARAVSGTPLPATAREVLAEVSARYPQISVQAYTAERAYLLQDTEFLQRKSVREELEPRVSGVGDIEGDLFKIVMACPDAGLLEECGKAFFGGDELHFAFSSRHFAEAVAAGAGKGSAVRMLAEKLGVPMANTFAAGDAMTDLPMFQVCGCSFAMADAAQPLIDASRYTVPVCEEGGMAQAFDIAIDLMAKEV